MEFFAYLILIWLFCIILLLLFYARDLLALWREPVLGYPVMIVESDDWGAGPLSQAAALIKLTEILGSHFDSKGRHPVMTIAVVLAIPDGNMIGSTGKYHRLTLAEPRFLQVLQALRSGVEGGVFFLQLHGLEHYWPTTLMTSQDSEVQAWLRQAQPQSTEALPSHLQSRWLDASNLPSAPLAKQAIESAVEEETSLFLNLLGQPAQVVVPPTFIWGDEVEAAWARGGVEFVVTPGRRYSLRGKQGEPVCTDAAIRNGDSSNGITYLVRNDYFEPGKGHTAGDALAAMTRKTEQGRPCLLETHRVNFLGGEAKTAFAELDRLMTEAARCFPDLRYMETLELGMAIRAGSDELLEQRWLYRLLPWISRVEELARFGKLARLTGLMAVLRSLAHLAAGRLPRAPMATK